MSDEEQPGLQQDETGGDAVQWLRATSPPPNALWVGLDLNNKDLYPARSLPDPEKPGIWVGKIGPFYKGLWAIITSEERVPERLFKEYEALMVSGDDYQWVPVALVSNTDSKEDSDDDVLYNFDSFETALTLRDSWLREIPANALVGGEDAEGRPLYVARMAHRGAKHPAVAGPQTPGGCHLAYGGPQDSKTFEVLVPLDRSAGEPRPVRECREFLEVYTGDIIPGKRYAVVSATWMKEWLDFVRLDSFFRKPTKNVAFGWAPEGPIKNESLRRGGSGDLDTDDDDGLGAASAPAAFQQLRRGMVEFRDYILVNVEAYEKLKEWYGGSDHDFIRLAGKGVTGNKVEFFPVGVHTYEFAEDGSAPVPGPEVPGKLELLAPTMTMTEYVQQFVPDADQDETEVKEGSPIDSSAWDHARLWWWESPLPAGPSTTTANASVTNVDAMADVDATDEPKAAAVQGRWQLMGPMSRKQTLQAFWKRRVEDQKVQGLKFLVDRKKADGSWSMEPRPWGEFEVGDVVDALDTANKWYESLVEEVKTDGDGDTVIRIHYLGWSRKYDTDMPLKTEKQPSKTKQVNMLAPRNTHTHGMYVKPAPAPKPSSMYSNYYGGGGYSNFYSRSSTKGTPEAPGAVGLVNLGNTCFMNSTLSCLLHTRPLKNFMLSDKWQQVINRSSVLGWKGEAAEEYAALTKEYWSNDYKIVAPSKLKQVIGTHKPRFAGYQQQDSSELLSELLDGLDEDLNTVTKKPATDKIESDGRPDHVVAAESWLNHLKRNNSVIMEIFAGQIKNTVDCPDCDRLSVTFDPITYFSVPLPSIKDVQVTVIVKFADPALPLTRYAVTVAQMDMMHNLKRKLCDMINAEGNVKLTSGNLWAADIWKRKVHRWADAMACRTIQPSDVIVLYEASDKDYEAPQCHLQLTPDQMQDAQARKKTPAAVISAMQAERPGQARPADCLPLAVSLQARDQNNHWQTFGQPIMVPVNRGGEGSCKTRNVDVWAAVNRQMFRFFTPAAKLAYTERGELPYSVQVRDSMGRYCGYHPYRNCSCSLPLDEEPFQLELDRFADLPTLDLCLVVLWEDVADTFDGTVFTQMVNHLSVDTGNSVDEAPKVGGSISLQACLDAFTQEEVLEESEAWYCNQCKDHKCARKKFDLWKLPDVAIIHLKRFHYSRVYREKVTTLVEFPLEDFSFKQWCKNPEHENDVYDLFAVSNHSGGMGGGHYTAYVKNEQTGQWYMHNDESVSRMADPQQVVTSQAYLLFYQRRQAKE